MKEDTHSSEGWCFGHADVPINILRGVVNIYTGNLYNGKCKRALTVPRGGASCIPISPSISW